MESWNERREGGARIDPGPGESIPQIHAGTHVQVPSATTIRNGPLPPVRLPSPLPLQLPLPHRVVELGDGRHDGVVVLAPIHLRAAGPQLVPPVRDAHGRCGALEELLP